MWTDKIKLKRQVTLQKLYQDWLKKEKKKKKAQESIAFEETELVDKNIPEKKMKSLDYIILLASKNSRKKEFQSYTTLSLTLKKRKYFITHFYEVSITLILKLDKVWKTKIINIWKYPK